MRYSELTPLLSQTEKEPELPGWPALMNPDLAAKFVGGELIFGAMLEAGWVRPVVKQKRLTRYHQQALAAAVARFASGEALLKSQSDHGGASA